MSDLALVPIQEVKKPANRTKKAVNSYVERLVAANTPEIAEAIVKAIFKQLGESDVKTIQLASQILGLVKTPGGPTINNTINNANVQTTKGKRGIESIIHDLDRRRISDGQIMDGDFEEVDEKGGAV